MNSKMFCPYCGEKLNVTEYDSDDCTFDYDIGEMSIATYGRCEKCNRKYSWLSRFSLVNLENEMY